MMTNGRWFDSSSTLVRPGTVGLSLLLLLLLAPAHAATFTVNLTGDSADANPLDDVCDVSPATAGSQCTLRAAIQEANSRFGIDTIAFEIPCITQICPVVKTIQPDTLLPTITDRVIIDGTTQSGYTSRPIVQISGGGGLSTGFHITGGSSTVRGLIISGFSGQFPGSGAGISIEGGGGNVIQLSWIGTNSTGTSASSNGTGVYILNSAGNTIGGPSARNVISGNYTGISISGAASTGTMIGSNYIGLNESGTAAILQSAGVFLSSSGTVVGGASGRNVISGNNTGILIDSAGTGNTIAGNYIGPSADGISAVANVVEGIALYGADNIIEGANIISGNERGIVNAGPAALRNRITGNYIGLRFNGITPLPNVQNGVLVSGGSATVGTPSSVNTIAHNGGAGVAVTGNAIAQIHSKFFSNGGLAIDLAQDGVTPNDAGDGDTGPNNLLNYPVITRVIRVNGTIQITGTAESRGIMYFFTNDVCDSTGYGEGADDVYSLFANAPGSFVFYSRDDILPAGGSITATISDMRELETDVAATSEFTACAQAVPGLRGDANGDGTVTVSDVFFLVSHLFANGPVPVGFGDVNADRSLRVSDVFYLVNYLFAGGAAPPP